MIHASEKERPGKQYSPRREVVRGSSAGNTDVTVHPYSTKNERVAPNCSGPAAASRTSAINAPHAFFFSFVLLPGEDGAMVGLPTTTTS
jgi:hypothetical protein